MTRPLLGLRRVVANAIWAVAHRIYPYTDRTPDQTTTFYWDMSATFVGTEAEADEWFDRLTSLTCENEKPLHDCRFMVGGMTRGELEGGDRAAR